MTTVLEEMQFEILPYADADSGIAFGGDLEISVDEEGFMPGGTEWYTEDTENPINGATSFGQDHLLGPSWAWNLFVNAENTKTAAAALARISTAWRAKEIRDEVGAVLAIRYQFAGRTRRVYGRPRRFENTLNNRVLGGYAPIAADFKCVDAYTYDDEEQQLKLGLVVDGVGGFTFPVTFPITTLKSGLNTGQAVVDGDADTHPVIRFIGPLVNPSIECEDWALRLNVVLTAGEYIEIDTRPWVNTILHSGGASVPDVLGPRQYLSKIVMTPGTHDFAFSGSASTGDGSCTVRWRPAWDSI